MNIIKALCVLWPHPGGNDEKVYCKECEHCLYLGYYKYECHHPKNLGTWLSKTDPKDHPSDLNRENDCKWFERNKGKIETLHEPRYY